MSRFDGLWAPCMAALAIASAAPVARGQVAYYNVEAGRPLRIDDATPTERYGLDVELTPLRVERYPGGLLRLRADPKISYGILPLTELSIRVPVLRLQSPDSGVNSATGVASLAFGAAHAITLEGPRIPAFAVAGEWLAPYGRFAPPRASFAVKALMTKTFSQVRFHLNASGGTYSVQPSPVTSQPSCTPPPRLSIGPPPPGVTYCAGSTPVIPDVPCDVVPSRPIGDGLALASASMFCGGIAPTSSTAQAPAVESRDHGNRAALALGIDHAFAFTSTLLIADIASERFFGLYPTADLVGEIGIRQQVSPRVVIDAGLSRRFRGAAQFTALTFGTTLDLALPIGRREAK